MDSLAEAAIAHQRQQKQLQQMQQQQHHLNAASMMSFGASNDASLVGEKNSGSRFSPPTSTTLSPEQSASATALNENGVRLSDALTRLDELNRKQSRVEFSPMDGVEMSASTSSSLMLSELSAAAAAAAAAATSANGTNDGAAYNSADASANDKDKEERPSLSYKDLIIEAIQSSPEKRLKLSEIYQVIRCLHPYYSRRADQWGWQNSIRHNLSLHDCFIKLPLKQTTTTGVVGHFWTVVKESEEKQGSATRRRSRAGAGGAGGDGGGKHAGKHGGKMRASHHHQNGGSRDNDADAINNNGNGALNGLSCASYAGGLLTSPIVASCSTAALFNDMHSSAIATTNASALAAVAAAAAAAGIPASAVIAPTNGAKTKDNHSVSSDSGVISDESQSSSPTTSSSTTTAATANAPTNPFISNGLLNGLLAGSGLDLHQQHQALLYSLNNASAGSTIRKASSSIFANSIASVNTLRGVTTSTHSAATSPNIKSSQQPALTNFSPNALQLLSSVISPAFSQHQAQTLVASTSSAAASPPTDPAVAIAALLQQNATLNNTTNSGTQLLESTCKNRLFIQQQQQNHSQQTQQSTTNNEQQLNSLLLPLISAINSGAAPSVSAAASGSPLLNRVAALNTVLAPSAASPLLSAAAGNLDSSLVDLLAGASTPPLNGASTGAGATNLAGELQRLQFLQFCFYQQSVIQQLLAGNGGGGTTPTSLLAELGNIIAQNNNNTSSTSSTLLVEQLATLLAQVQQQQNHVFQVPHSEPQQQNQSNQSHQQQSATNVLSQLLLSKLVSPQIGQQKVHSSHQTTAQPQPPASAPPAPISNGEADFGTALAAAAFADAMPRLSADALFVGVSKTSTHQQKQLLDLFLTSQQHNQNTKASCREAAANSTAGDSMELDSMPLDMKLSTRKTSTHSAGNLHIDTNHHHHDNTAFQHHKQQQQQEQQQKLINSLLEQFMVQNGSRFAALNAEGSGATEEGVVSTTTAPNAPAGGEMPGYAVSAVSPSSTTTPTAIASPPAQ